MINECGKKIKKLQEVSDDIQLSPTKNSLNEQNSQDFSNTKMLNCSYQKNKTFYFTMHSHQLIIFDISNYKHASQYAITKQQRNETKLAKNKSV